MAGDLAEDITRYFDGTADTASLNPCQNLVAGVSHANITEFIMSAQKITTAGFLSEFLARHKKMSDRPFCWVLGSGASYQSGIPTGNTLAMQWLKELHEMEDFNTLPIEKWANAANLGIKDFDFQKAANFYPFIYQLPRRL